MTIVELIIQTIAALGAYIAVHAVIVAAFIGVCAVISWLIFKLPSRRWQAGLGIVGLVGIGAIITLAGGGELTKILLAVFWWIPMAFIVWLLRQLAPDLFQRKPKARP